MTGRAEYGSNVLAYWQAARRTGAEVVVVPNDEHGQLDVDALGRLAGERTRLIGVSQSGPGATHTAAARERNAPKATTPNTPTKTRWTVTSASSATSVRT